VGNVVWRHLAPQKTWQSPGCLHGRVLIFFGGPSLQVCSPGDDLPKTVKIGLNGGTRPPVNRCKRAANIPNHLNWIEPCCSQCSLEVSDPAKWPVWSALPVRWSSTSREHMPQAPHETRPGRIWLDEPGAKSHHFGRPRGPPRVSRKIGEVQNHLNVVE
jgi:hypothetical protein